MAVKYPIAYSQARYDCYEHAVNADRAKKVLEFECAMHYIHEAPSGTPAFSADWGCATGRYPRHFARIGYRAQGYDNSADAIDLCREKALRSPNRDRLAFIQADILQTNLESGHYSIITSMMGTFNHFSYAEQHILLRKCFDALISDGTLMLSVWNPDCPYLGFLSFYNEEERQELLQNALPFAALKGCLHETGFHSIRGISFCYGTDAKYDHIDRVSDRTLFHMDEAFAVQRGIPQMYLIVGYK